ncbi:hypothetical protein GN956_G15902 [Arapaima gigas]
MDSDSLHSSLDLVSGGGSTLSCEQRAALQTSLIILKRNYKFSRVLFWGKILGLRSDYFIAHGIAEDEMANRKTLYSFNCVDWHLLPPVTEAQLTEVLLLKERFKGDPSHEYEHTETSGLDEGDEAVVEEITVSVVKMTEETRLAATVLSIDREVSVVPRGAFIKTPSGRVQVNRCFEGLSESEAGKLSSYLHFSVPQQQKKKTILEIADLDPSIDFLDNLSEDMPKGSWSLQFERGSIVVLRSLLWLGLTFFHVPMTPQHGYVYMGDGLRNHYLPFML